MKARIYRPTKTAMQSGRARTKEWVLEYEQVSSRFIDPVMGWTGSEDMRQEIKLRFVTKDEAIAYAKRKGLEFELFTPNEPVVKPKSYADNFLK